MPLWSFLRPRNYKNQPIRRPARLEFEHLENRSVPSTTPGSISGTVFLAANSVPDLPGIPVTLSGTTDQGTSVNLSTATDTTGAFDFATVPTGTYSVSAGPVAGFLGGTGTTMVAAVTVGSGQAVSQNFGFQGIGINPTLISMRMFLTESSAASFPIGGTPGAPVTQVDHAPVVSSVIAPVSLSSSSSTATIDLAGHFTDSDITNGIATFNTSAGPINVQLFTTTTPQTVANFNDYVQSGAYNNSIFSRLANLSTSDVTATPQILQGGGATLTTSGSSSNLVGITPLAPVPGEFGASNTAGTLAMALSTGPNSGTDQFYFNLTDNSAALDPQKFTVFGKIADAASQQVLNTLAATPRQDESSAITIPGVGLNDVPLNNYTGTSFPTDATASNFLLVNSITVTPGNDSLTYSLVSNSNPTLVTATLNSEKLALSFTAGQTGTATITVQATDRFGATVQTSFTVTVS